MSSLGMTMKGLKEVAIVNTGTGETSVQQKEMFGLRLWQLGLLVGVPSAMAIFYLYYNKSKTSSDSSQDNKKNKSGASTKSSAQKPAKKKPEDMVNFFNQLIKNCLNITRFYRLP